MAASVTEQILARLETLLVDAGVADGNVERGRQAPFDEDELPGLNIKRTEGTHESLGGNAERVVAAWEIEHHVKGADWETRVDALHMQVDVLLKGDAQLVALGRGLRCLGTHCEGDAASTTAGKLTARYQMQISVRSSDLTRAIK